MEVHQTNVNMDGLLEVLGKNLYSTPAVVIRELIQNAHDACIRRKIEDNNSHCGNEFKISLVTEPNQNILTIEDNGSGLTHNEILEFLATIGSGYTRVLRDNSQTEEMIGYFGLGFLSSYVVAKKVEVITTSYQTPNKTWQFISKGGKAFSLNQVSNKPVGSKVILNLKNEYQKLADSFYLKFLVEKYCCLLPIPIKINESSSINKIDVPWLVDKSTPSTRKTIINMEFASRFEENFKPMCAFEIPDHHGILWVQESSLFGVSDYRNVSIFIRNMFITHEGRELLPNWASFIGCVIDTPMLTPTASREGIRQDENFLQLKNDIEKALIYGLTNIATEKPELWKSILKRHNQELLGVALHNDQLFELLKNELTIPTTIGEMSPLALLHKSEQVIYIRGEDKNNYQDVLFRAQQIPVVKGYLYAAAGFCQKYGELCNKKVVYLDTQDGEQEIFKPITDNYEDINEEDANSIIRAFSHPNDEVRLTRFIPNYIPLIVTENKELKLKKSIENDKANLRVGSAALALARLHTQKIDGSVKHFVYINMNNALINKISTIGESKRSLLAKALRAYMFGMCKDPDNDDISFAKELNVFITSLEELVL